MQQTSEVIDATEGRADDGQNSHTMTSADRAKQS